MSIEIKVPVLPESVADALLAVWHVKEGDFVNEGDNLVDLETDKVMLEVPATVSGTIQSIKIPEGTNVTAGELLAVLVEGEAAPVEAAKEEAPVAAASEDAHKLSPAVKVLVEENKLDVSVIPATGKDGRHTKEDILKFLESGQSATKAAAPVAPKATPAAAPLNIPMGNRTEQRVPMTRLRATIADRLLEAKNSTAMLTTFNEVNMKNVIELRKKYKDEFEKRHGIKLGFMSFFVKAAVEALKKYPAVNASIDGNDMIYHGYFDIGVAVSSPRGLVVPVIRDADQKSLADIEKTIMDFAIRAKEGKLGLEDMTGGTFPVTNGG
uniref:dihydrolipoyllysine-residue succinyltransferase n=1 Tax=Wohlfahrtiimonas larvae TaxID=1157986 RepID=UPI00098D64ED